jgi:hypothetical protein
VSYSPALYRDVSTGPNQIRLAGSFVMNGASAIDNTQNRGKGFTVARTAPGTFSINLTSSYLSLIMVVGTTDYVTTGIVYNNAAVTNVASTTAPTVGVLVSVPGSGTIDQTGVRVYFDLVLSTDGSNK